MSNSTPAVRRWMGLVWRLGTALAFAFIIIAALVVALLSMNRADSTANCVNNALADHNGVNAADATAHLEFIEAVNSLLAQPPHQSVARQLAEVAAFRVEVQHVKDVLAADQAFRARHPLGRC